MDFSKLSIEIDNDTQDITPPSLSDLSFSNDKRIFKVGDTLELDATVEDDLSGISDISVLFSNKDSNRVIEAYYQYDPSLVGNKYKLQTKIQPFQKNGLYTAERIILRDKAGNDRIYNKESINFINLSFEIVNDIQDNTPPSLLALSFPNEKRVFKEGDTLELHVTAEDRESGISGISGIFINRNTGKTIPIMYSLEYKPIGNVYKLQGPIRPSLEDGVYKLEYLAISDKVGNSISYSSNTMDFKNISIEIKNTDVPETPGNGGNETPPTGGNTTPPPSGGGSEQTSPPVTTPKPFVIKGVENNAYYSKNLAIEFENGTIQLNGKNYSSGTPITEEGTHTLSITTSTGEKSEMKFVLDKTPPEISLESSNKKVTNKDITIHLKSTDKTTTIKSITLPDGSIKTGSSLSYTVKQNGVYTFQVTDLANNTTSKDIKISNIDKKAPSVPTIKTVATKSIKGQAEKNTTIYLLKGKTVLAKAAVSKNGTFTISFKKQNKNTVLSLYLKDTAGNKSKSIKIKAK